MEGDIIEFGDLPMNDPTLEDGAVMVFRNTTINHLVEIAMAQLSRDDMEVPAHLRWRDARQAVLELISGDPQPQSHVEWEDTHRNMGATLLNHLRKSTGIDTNRYRLGIFMALIYGNTLVMIYGMGDRIQ